MKKMTLKKTAGAVALSAVLALGLLPAAGAASTPISAYLSPDVTIVVDDISRTFYNAQGAEGGANIFKLDYFGKTVFLAQSPQLYKQALVPVYERVFEIGPVFRAEHHDTSRHLNEYISMDFEMGFIDSFTDIMEMETGVLKYIMNLLKTEYVPEIELLKADIPEIDKIPCIRFKDAKELCVKKLKNITDMKDFEPEEEAFLGKWAKQYFFNT